MEKIKFSPKIKSQLKKLGVAIVYLFGSRAQGTHYPNSDYDIGIVFINSKKIENSVKLYSQIYAIITQVIPDIVDGTHPDISFLQKSNPALQAAAIKYGIILYEADPIFTANYIERVIKLYNDYLPLKHEFEDVTFRAFK